MTVPLTAPPQVESCNFKFWPPGGIIATVNSSIDLWKVWVLYWTKTYLSPFSGQKKIRKFFIDIYIKWCLCYKTLLHISLLIGGSYDCVKNSFLVLQRWPVKIIPGSVSLYFRWKLKRGKKSKPDGSLLSWSGGYLHVKVVFFYLCGCGNTSLQKQFICLTTSFWLVSQTWLCSDFCCDVMFIFENAPQIDVYCATRDALLPFPLWKAPPLLGMILSL